MLTALVMTQLECHAQGAVLSAGSVLRREVTQTWRLSFPPIEIGRLFLGLDLWAS